MGDTGVSGSGSCIAAKVMGGSEATELQSWTMFGAAIFQSSDFRPNPLLRESSQLLLQDSRNRRVGAEFLLNFIVELPRPRRL